MKQYLFTLLMILIAIPAFSQTKSIKQFYKKYKRTENTFNITAPGWLIRLGANIAVRHAEDPEEEAALRLAKKVRKARIMVMEDRCHIAPEDFTQLLADAYQDNFEDLIMVRDEDATINLMIREEGDVIKDMLILVDEGESFILLALKTKIHIDDINEVIRASDIAWNDF